MLRLVAFDMDGTLVRAESSWAHVHAHFGERNDEGLRRFNAGEINDEEFLRSDVKLWHKHRPDLSYPELATILSSVPLMPGAKALLAGLRAEGIRTAIISGGIDLLAERIGRELGIERTLANGFRVDPSGRINGEGIIRVPIHGKEGVLEALQREWKIPVEATASVGNSEIDIGLFKRSALGIAFRPEDEEVREAATHVEDREDLSLLLPVLLGRTAPNRFSRPAP